MLKLDVMHEIKVYLLDKYGPEPRLDSVRLCQIKINDRMRSTAGRANYTSNTIFLNSRLLKANPQQIPQVFAHELAHLVSFALHGHIGRGHGKLWQSVMLRFGYVPDRTHGMDVSGLKRRHAVKGHASCKCKTHALKAKRYNKMIRGVKYTCLLCNTDLELIDNNDTKGSK